MSNWIVSFWGALRAERVAPRLLRAGVDIIKQGEVGNDFYMIEEGTAEAWKTVNGETKKVLKLEHITRSRSRGLKTSQGNLNALN